ncbi:MAG: nucleotidyltransferase [Syntrophomonadaceae bacterium]|nr:nucleotidyltransferase [Syntrophomonadaceae bacterium]
MSQKIVSLSDKFRVFINNLNIEDQNQIQNRVKEMTKHFNLKYWYITSDIKNVHYIGSYGRGTAIKGVKNINLLAVLPPALFKQYDTLPGNGQQFLLRQVRDFLVKHYPLAKINDEGHLIIPFSHEITFEFIPSFLNAKKNYTYPDIHNDGTWVNFNPIREIEVVDEANFKYNGKIKHLAKMMRAWKALHNVPISGMLLDTLVLSFMEEWEDNTKSYAVYGDMTQDFLEYLSSLRKDQLHWYAKGSNRQLPSTADFGAQADISYKEVVKANNFEKEGETYKANNHWKAVYGDAFPVNV